MKYILTVLSVLALTACSSDDIREISVEVSEVYCGEGRLFSDAGCTLVTSDGRNYEYGTPLLNLNKGDNVVITVKGFNKVKKLRYIEEN